MYFECVERTLYWTVWVTTTIYALYKFAMVNQSDIPNYSVSSSQHFKEGTLSENLYDASDFEWQSFKKLYTDYWYILLLHFISSTVFSAAKQPALKLTSWILITLYATYTVFSMAALLVVIINIMMLILMAILGKNILSYGLCFGVVLASQSTDIANRIFNSNDPRMTNEFDFEEKRFLFTYCICFLNARGLSSALDNLTIRQKKEIQTGKDQFYEKVLTIVAYLLYLPGFFAGPLYMYNDFEAATRLVKREPEKESFLGTNYFKSMASLFILIINIIYYEWLLHWLYSSAISQDFAIVSHYNSWQFSGFVVSLCILFYMKYTCIFGAFKVLATFDGLNSISPPLPQCVLAMHLSSQLWRKFDVGIYNWLRIYIYNPIAKTGCSAVKRFFATLVCFFCIALWHLPLSPSLTIWITLNIIGAIIEIWSTSFATTELWNCVKQRISRSNYLRLLALLGLPLFILAIQSNLFFLAADEKVAGEFGSRIINNIHNYSIFLLFVLYCGANVSIDYNRLVKNPVDCLGFLAYRKENVDLVKGIKQTKSN